MYKNVEIIFPFAENKEANILFVAQMFVSLEEMSLEESLTEVLKFKKGEDMIVLISEKNLAKLEGWMQTLGYFYKVVHRR